MKRKFRGDRLYKLTKIIVIVVTVVSLSLGILSEVRSKELTDIYLQGNSDCLLKFHLSDEACNKWIDDLNNYDFQKKLFLEIGIFLPLIFFGGGALIRYLFPEKEVGNKS